MIVSGWIAAISSAITNTNLLRGSFLLFFRVKEQNPWQGAHPARSETRSLPTAFSNSLADTFRISLSINRVLRLFHPYVRAAMGLTSTAAATWKPALRRPLVSPPQPAYKSMAMGRALISFS
jgi:hypothetical protein